MPLTQASYIVREFHVILEFTNILSFASTLDPAVDKKPADPQCLGVPDPMLLTLIPNGMSRIFC